MAINFTKYVDITSGVIGGAGVKRKDLIPRIFTNNELVPPDTVLQFTSSELSVIGELFGTTSEEYKRASFYFGFISKSTKSPKKISYYRYVNADLTPKIFGGTDTKAYTDFTSITDGSFDLEIGGVTNTITTNFSTATSLADVASLIETQVQAETESQFATATVVYNATRGSFDFTGGIAEDATISVSTASTGTDVIDLLGWNATAIFSNGKLTETLTQNLDASINLSTNFATLMYVYGITLSIDDKKEIGAWSKAQNVRYLFLTTTSYNDAQSHYDNLIIYGGVDVALKGIDGEYHEMCTACIAGATAYNQPNSVQNYMYYQFALTPTITDNTKSSFLDNLRINYYGQTQVNGQNISFYQRGNLMGLSTDPLSENVFINEVWFKDTVGAVLLELLLNKQQVAWNGSGRADILNVLQDPIDSAISNGVISTDKPLTAVQKQVITDITNDGEVWKQVQSTGYWVDCLLTSETLENSITEYNAEYTIIYAKSDAIRKISGTHSLI